MMLLMGGLMGIAEETEQDAQEKVEASADEQAEGEEYSRRMEVLKERADKLEAQYKEIKEPDRVLTREHERFTRELKEQEEKVSKQIEELNTLQAKQKELMSGGFEFTIVPSDQRMKYIEEGKEVIKKAVSGMEGRSDGKQTAGMGRFLQARTKYQGLKEYKAARKTFLAVLDKHAKRWTRAAETIRKAREKKRPEDNEKVQQAEERAFQRTGAELKEQGRDIRKDLFTPVQNNLLMLEALCQTATSLKKTVEGERTEGQGETEEVLTELWAEMDKVAQLMAQGKAEEAEEAFKESEEVERFRLLRPECLSEEVRENTQKQIETLRTEVRERERELGRTERNIRRNTMTLERLLESLTHHIDGFETSLNDYVDAEKAQREQERERAETSEGEKEEGDEGKDSDTEGKTGENAVK